MKEVKCNIWDLHDKGNWVCVLTNGNVDSNGHAIMGAGIALEAKSIYPELPAELGYLLKKYGNKLYAFEEYRIFIFPTKDNVWEMSSISLIEKSYTELANYLDTITIPLPVYLPRPGCGYGGLEWEYVKGNLMLMDDSRIVIVSKPGEKHGKKI